eukprot:2761013-Amphidinium_carterae.1
MKWAHVPIRRLKSAANGMAAWLVGADAPPQALHARIGAVLVTVEQYDLAARPQRKQANRQALGNKENWKPSRTQNEGHNSLDWDPWASASSKSRSSGDWWSSGGDRHRVRNPLHRMPGAATSRRSKRRCP